MEYDVPEINVSTAPCGAATNPHVVGSPSALFCGSCGANLSGVLVERLAMAAGKALPQSQGGDR